MNDPQVIKYLESGGDYTIFKLKSFLKDVEKKKILFWAINIKKTNNHIGNIKIDPVHSNHGTCEYGIMMGDKLEWRKGYAKEASELVIKYCYDNLNLRKITLGVVEKNTSAIELYKKLNFTIEGRFINHVNYDGVLYNMIRMALFNKNYI